MAHASRNHLLAGGVPRYSRSAMYRRKALYKRKKVKVDPKQKKSVHFKVKPVKGDKNGEKRVVPAKKTRRSYPTEDNPRRIHSRKVVRPQKLRASLAPGCVLILLAGSHMGKRVVFLKQLPSGQLLVTGPFCVNGVPLRRVNQAYVIATKTKIDISEVQLPEALGDGYFKRKAQPKKSSGGESEIFQDSEQKYSVSEQRKEDQKKVDSQLVPLIKTTPHMRQYLRSKFTLRKGQYPHMMVF